ncbi:hypothetical protein [Microscilla marina]|uniref:Uncharacterized protein n=1 Tax=Microscilla marina ATCC 23134 TaxID=313606 RepID=A1ZUM3_MICM2|nr:hypothetical protein [Microscilla marina]EAY25909.1 hypothetical protein M23134_00863 [Microscilla marina ATCC 23134]
MSITKSKPSTEKYTVDISLTKLGAELKLPKQPDRAMAPPQSFNLYAANGASQGAATSTRRLTIYTNPLEQVIHIINAVPVPGYHAEGNELNPLGFKLRDAITKKIKVQMSGYFSMYKMPLSDSSKDQKVIDAFYAANPLLPRFDPLEGRYQQVFFPELDKANISSDKDVPYNDQFDRFFPAMKKNDWEDLCICMVCQLIKEVNSGYKDKIKPEVDSKVSAYNQKIKGSGGHNIFRFYQYLMEEWMKDQGILGDDDNRSELLDLYKKVLSSNSFISEYRLGYDRGGFLADWFWFHAWLKLLILGGNPKDVDPIYALLESRQVFMPKSVASEKWMSYDYWFRMTDHTDSSFFRAIDIDQSASMALRKTGTAMIPSILIAKGKKSTSNIYAELFFGRNFKETPVVGTAEPDHNDAPGKQYSSVKAPFSLPDWLPKPPTPAKVYGDLVTKGYAVAHAVTHPKETVENIADAVTHPAKTVKKVWNHLKFW